MNRDMAWSVFTYSHLRWAGSGQFSTNRSTHCLWKANLISAKISETRPFCCANGSDVVCLCWKLLQINIWSNLMHFCYATSSNDIAIEARNEVRGVRERERETIGAQVSEIYIRSFVRSSVWYCCLTYALGNCIAFNLYAFEITNIVIHYGLLNSLHLNHSHSCFLAS